MKNPSAALVQELGLTYGQLRHSIKKGFEVAMFMETFGHVFRVHQLSSRDGDMLLATVSEDQKKTRRHLLIHVGQAIWLFDVVEAGAEPVPIGFGPPQNQQ
jgi:hypothetical protein